MILARNTGRAAACNWTTVARQSKAAEHLMKASRCRAHERSYAEQGSMRSWWPCINVHSGGSAVWIASALYSLMVCVKWCTVPTTSYVHSCMKDFGEVAHTDDREQVYAETSTKPNAWLQVHAAPPSFSLCSHAPITVPLLKFEMSPDTLACSLPVRKLQAASLRPRP